jgi:hypothetical protein
MTSKRELGKKHKRILQNYHDMQQVSEQKWHCPIAFDSVFTKVGSTLVSCNAWTLLGELDKHKSCHKGEGML